MPGLLDLYADDATVEDPFGKSLLKGRAAIDAMYTQALAFIVHTRESMIHVTDVMTFNESGKITSMRAYWGPDDLESCD